MANRYSKALKHLKNKTIDEKLELLEALPINNTTGIFVDVPGVKTPERTEPGEIDSELNLSQDGDGSEEYTGDDTTGLFETDGTIKAVEPPGDTSYVLGPMISMWYAWANYTQIGYVRQSDRKMVNLGRIVGEMSDWDGETGFTSYGQLTLEQAVWFKEQSRSDYRAFYPGPPSNTPDEYGRYRCTITGTTKPTTVTPPIRRVPPVQGGPNAAGYPSWGNNPTSPRPNVPPLPPEPGAPPDLIGNLILLGISAALAKGLVFALKLGVTAGVNALAPKVVNVLKNLKPKPTYGPPKAKYPTTPKSVLAHRDLTIKSLPS